jgi:chemotaxis response regulator CheB
MQLKCVVVDDSAIQRLAITKLVEDHPALELVAEYSSALETKKASITIK